MYRILLLTSLLILLVTGQVDEQHPVKYPKHLPPPRGEYLTPYYGQWDYVRYPFPDIPRRNDLSYYAGSLAIKPEVEGYYWFFESMNKPATDPIVFWFPSVDGCSSIIATLTGIGPIRTDREGESKLNPHTWNLHANLLFVEMPANSNIKKVLKMFHAKFPQFAKHEIILAGEEGAAQAFLSIQEKIPNVSSIIIGNGNYGAIVQLYSKIHYLFFHGMIGLKRYRSFINGCCQDNDLFVCAKSPKEWLDACTGTRQDIEMYIKQLDLINFQNVYDKCYKLTDDEQKATENMGRQCRSMDHLERLVHQADINMKDRSDWRACRNRPPVEKFNFNEQVTRLRYLQSQYKMLLYNGDRDSEGNIVYTSWLLQGVFNTNSAEQRFWKVNDPVGYQFGGVIRKYGKNLMFATVRGAGAEAAHDKPAEVLQIFQEFLKFRTEQT